MSFSRFWRISLWFILIIVAGILITLLRSTAFSLRPLQPARNTATPAGTINSQPILITFPELNVDPSLFNNQRLRVTGEFQPVAPPDCFPMNGPLIEWSLIAEGLQLNAQGFEGVLRAIAPGTVLTVDGVWRQYMGPLGCGKQPADGTMWYLVVEQIVQPNPLVAMGYTPGPLVAANGDVTPIGVLPTATAGTVEPTVSGTAVSPSPTPTATGTLIGAATATASNTPPAGTSGTAVTNTPTRAITPSLTPSRTPTTATGGTPSVTPTPSRTPTPGAPVSPIATSPPGYPGPQPTIGGVTVTPYP